MGNCQAADAAAVVIQYPGRKVERLHWPTAAANVMKSNPGYHVALVTLYIPTNERQDGDGGVGNRITRVKLLKPKEMLLLGQVYRLITSQGSYFLVSLFFCHADCCCLVVRSELTANICGDFLGQKSQKL